MVFFVCVQHAGCHFTPCSLFILARAGETPRDSALSPLPPIARAPRRSARARAASGGPPPPPTGDSRPRAPRAAVEHRLIRSSQIPKTRSLCCGSQLFVFRARYARRRSKVSVGLAETGADVRRWSVRTAARSAHLSWTTPPKRCTKREEVREEIVDPRRTWWTGGPPDRSRWRPPRSGASAPRGLFSRRSRFCYFYWRW
jgi:hypothetical protein